MIIYDEMTGSTNWTADLDIINWTAAHLEDITRHVVAESLRKIETR